MPWCLGGQNILFEESFANMIWFQLIDTKAGMDPVDDKQQPMHFPEPPLQRLDEEELQRILDRHQQWLGALNKGRPNPEEPADLSRTDLTGINLDGADLRGANLHAADLKGTSLLKAKLQEADLGEANLKDANRLLAKQLADADLAGTQLQEAILDQKTDLPEYLDSCRQ